MAKQTGSLDLKSARKAYESVNQYFWHESSGGDAGAHITEVPQDEWSDPNDPNYHSGGNLLAKSTTVQIRMGTIILAELDAIGVQIGQNGAGQQNVTFTQNGLNLNYGTVTPAGMNWFYDPDLGQHTLTLNAGNMSLIFDDATGGYNSAKFDGCRAEDSTGAPLLPYSGFIVTDESDSATASANSDSGAQSFSIQNQGYYAIGIVGINMAGTNRMYQQIYSYYLSGRDTQGNATVNFRHRNGSSSTFNGTFHAYVLWAQCE